jgi:hypothetical protein
VYRQSSLKNFVEIIIRWFFGRVARQSSAKASTAVRIR